MIVTRTINGKTYILDPITNSWHEQGRTLPVTDSSILDQLNQESFNAPTYNLTSYEDDKFNSRVANHVTEDKIDWNFDNQFLNGIVNNTKDSNLNKALSNSFFGQNNTSLDSIGVTSNDDIKSAIGISGLDIGSITAKMDQQGANFKPTDIKFSQAQKAPNISILTKLGKNLKSNTTGVGGIVNGAIDTAMSFIPDKWKKDQSGNEYAALGEAASNAVNTISQFIPFPYSLIPKGMNILGKFWGSDNVTVQDALLNATGLGGLFSIGKGHKSQSFSRDTQVENAIGSSYSDSLQDFAYAKSIEGKRSVSKGTIRKFNRTIDDAKVQQQRMQDVYDLSQDESALAQSAPIYQLGYNTALGGGYNQAYSMVGKHGMRLLTRAQQILQNIQKQEPLEIADEPFKYKEGGKIEIVEEQVIEEIFDEILDEEPLEITDESAINSFEKGGSFNIIPEGALHARKHNLDIENVTTKGIPVVSIDDEGNIEQHAEIEKNEVIFRISVTEKIEDLRKKYEESKDDDIPVEVGKMLVQELLYNTQDNTGLINEVQ